MLLKYKSGFLFLFLREKLFLFCNMILMVKYKKNVHEMFYSLQEQIQIRLVLYIQCFGLKYKNSNLLLGTFHFSMAITPTGDPYIFYEKWF